ncbi:TIM barrel protein [Nonomuraea ferruginea]
MRKSIATVSVSGTLTEKLEAIAAAGFDGVEVFENDLVACPLPPEEIRLRADDLGLGIDMYQPLRDFEAVPDDVLKGNLRRAEYTFELMNRLGADTLLVCSNVSPDALPDDELAAAQLRLLAERAAGHGIRVAYEALAWGRHVSEYLHAWRIVRTADHPALGVCLDSFHILSRGSDPIGIEAIPGEKVFFLQLADAPRLAMDVLQWSRHYRCFPGQGGFDVTGLVRHVLATGYAGPLSLEVFNDVFRQSDARRTALDAMRSLIALEEALTPDGVPPVVPSGFAFAELATEGSAELPGILSALGFARTGTHRTKPVELWEQGGARVLLNAAPAESADEEPAAGGDRAGDARPGRFGETGRETARAGAAARARAPRRAAGRHRRPRRDRAVLLPHRPRRPPRLDGRLPPYGARTGRGRDRDRPRRAHPALAALRRGVAVLPRRARAAPAGEPGGRRPVRPAAQPRHGRAAAPAWSSTSPGRSPARRPGSTSRSPSATCGRSPGGCARTIPACCCPSRPTTTTTWRPGTGRTRRSGSWGCCTTGTRRASSCTCTR